jgi:hypothetical protein
MNSERQKDEYARFACRIITPQKVYNALMLPTERKNQNSKEDPVRDKNERVS